MPTRTKVLIYLLCCMVLITLGYFFTSFTKIGFFNQNDLSYEVSSSKNDAPIDFSDAHKTALTTANSDSTVKTKAVGFLGHLAETAEQRCALNIRYDGAYVQIPYPGGDVDPSTGVCTDVVIRSYRAHGIDLQKLVHEDMSDSFLSYPKLWGLFRPDSNIDHRRVPNLMCFFKRHGQVLERSTDAQDYKPGHIVCWRLPRNLTHIGIVSNTLNADKTRYQIVHNIGSGPQLEDCLFNWDIIGHYVFKTN